MGWGMGRGMKGEVILQMKSPSPSKDRRGLIVPQSLASWQGDKRRQVWDTEAFKKKGKKKKNLEGGRLGLVEEDGAVIAGQNKARQRAQHLTSSIPPFPSHTPPCFRLSLGFLPSVGKWRLFRRAYPFVRSCLSAVYDGSTPPTHIFSFFLFFASFARFHPNPFSRVFSKIKCTANSQRRGQRDPEWL